MADITIQHNLHVSLSKADDTRQMVYGWASVAELASGDSVVDLQGDIIGLDDLDAAFCEYAKDSRALNFMHDGPIRGTLIDLFISTPEKLTMLGLAPDALPHGAFVSYHIPDPLDYATAKRDGLLMFSIEGTAHREPA